jgi:hypothetical protein
MELFLKFAVDFQRQSAIQTICGSSSPAHPSATIATNVARRITPLDVDAHVRAAYSLRIRSQN